VPLQRRYLDKYVTVPHTRYFSTEGIDASHFKPDERLFPSDEHYFEKFEGLSREALERAESDDWLLFIDSDAFLLTDIQPLLETGTDLVGVQRLENGDFHPHPCFTLVKASQWTSLGKRNWDEGTWISSSGVPATEMGGLLLERINDQRVPWTQMTRVNNEGLHRLWFGVYGLDGSEPVVYHHGAGSRARVSRSDLVAKRDIPKAALKRLAWASKVGRRKALGLSVTDCLKGDPEVLNAGMLDLMTRDEDFWQLLV